MSARERRENGPMLRLGILASIVALGIAACVVEEGESDSNQEAVTTDKLVLDGAFEEVTTGRAHFVFRPGAVDKKGTFILEMPDAKGNLTRGDGEYTLARDALGPVVHLMQKTTGTPPKLDANGTVGSGAGAAPNPATGADAGKAPLGKSLDLHYITTGALGSLVLGDGTDISVFRRVSSYCIEDRDCEGQSKRACSAGLSCTAKHTCECGLATPPAATDAGAGASTDAAKAADGK